MDKITLNNAIALLEECVTNGENGPFILYAWFRGERDSIDRAIKEASLDDYDEE
jgi:hypothetical protein